MVTWAENIANTIRDLYKDRELKVMMMIPEADMNNIVAFRDRYFTNSVVSDEILHGENVLVEYSDESPMDTDTDHIISNRIYVHVYVKREQAYTYGDDRMIHRGKMIATRIHHLMCKKKHKNITFSCRGIYDMPSKLEGYDHCCAVFKYTRVYV